MAITRISVSYTGSASRAFFFAHRFRLMRSPSLCAEERRLCAMENLQPVSSEDLDSRCGLTAELDEMWSDVRSKANPRWLWHAIDHHSGQVLAYVFGRRQDTVFLQRQALLEPFGIPRYDTDGWGAYERHIDTEQHRVGKDNTQKIASKHMNLRTRITR